MTRPPRHAALSRRRFCLCCMAAPALGSAAGWLSPRAAYAEAMGVVERIKHEAAKSPIKVHRLRGNVAVLEGSGGNVAVLTGPDGKPLADAGIGVSRPQMLTALDGLGEALITHLINTHWHFDHADGNAWVNAEGAEILAHENTRKRLLATQRVEDWNYDFPAPPTRRAAVAGVLDGSRNGAERQHAGPEVLRAGAHRQRHLRALRRARHPACRRHVLERRLPVHRLLHGRPHRRDDRRGRGQPGVGDRPDDHHTSTTAPSRRT